MHLSGIGSANHELSEQDCRQWVRSLIQSLPLTGKRILIIPPDITLFHSDSGAITVMLFEELCSSAPVYVLPATGTHHPMTLSEQQRMFPGIPPQQFLTHDWKQRVVDLGSISPEVLAKISPDAKLGEIRVEANIDLMKQDWDHVISVGQVVPHEVAGFASYSKNLVVGLGGQDIINNTHYLSAVSGIERIMGTADNPVRRLLQYIDDIYLANLRKTYILIVRGRNDNGAYVTRALFSGNEPTVFQAAAHLSMSVNVTHLERPIRKAVVWLDPREYRSTWLGNKAIYRLRCAMADDGELIILGPGIVQFGEDAKIDALIRQFGYRGTPRTVKSLAENESLRNSLSAAAHLIHGSSEGRFRITYAAGGLSESEIESVGYGYGVLSKLVEQYQPSLLQTGWHRDRLGEEFFFVQNPGEGLWKLR